MASAPRTRIFAGLQIPDTPLINKAIAYSQEHLSPPAHNHVMRSFLYGVAVALNTGSERETSFDSEAHAISAILHDLGWDKTGRLVSRDKCYEVDGAIAASDFLKREADQASWSAQRIQIVWDAIALHTTNHIAYFKEPEVRICCAGIACDFRGPDGVKPGWLTWDQYNAIVKEFPKDRFVEDAMETLCGFCRDKPETTYETANASVGEKFVPGYSQAGHQ